MDLFSSHCYDVVPRVDLVVDAVFFQVMVNSDVWNIFIQVMKIGLEQLLVVLLLRSS